MYKYVVISSVYCRIVLLLYLFDGMYFAGASQFDVSVSFVLFPYLTIYLSFSIYLMVYIIHGHSFYVSQSSIGKPKETGFYEGHVTLPLDDALLDK